MKLSSYMKTKARPLLLVLLLPLFISGLLLAPLFSSNDVNNVGPVIRESHGIGIINGIVLVRGKDQGNCSGMAEVTICCDRSSHHSDICFMRGEVRMRAPSTSILLSSSSPNSSSAVERIRPYTRKWEAPIMKMIPELQLKIVDDYDHSHRHCDVRHDVPALFFSVSGYAGNVFHAFGDGLIPLYITSQHLNRQVVFVVLEYRHWWYTKYREILSQLSDYPLIDFSNDKRTHCFRDAIVGLRHHGTLMVDPSRTSGNKTIQDFHNEIIDNAYGGHSVDKNGKDDELKLVIMARDGTRVIENEREVVNMAKEIGFKVEVLRPKNTVPLAEIYRALNSCDVMMGVHGAALTHFLFMRPGSSVIQIVPLGIDELAQLCFGKAAPRMGIKYEEYKILPKESSLYRKYGGGDQIVRSPERVKKRGWEVTKEVYLEGQNVTLDISRLREHLVQTFRDANLKGRNDG